MPHYTYSYQWWWGWSWIWRKSIQWTLKLTSRSFTPISWGYYQWGRSSDGRCVNWVLPGAAEIVWAGMLPPCCVCCVLCMFVNVFLCVCVGVCVYVCTHLHECYVWIKQNSQTYLILYTLSNLGSPGQGRISSATRWMTHSNLGSPCLNDKGCFLYTSQCDQGSYNEVKAHNAASNGWDEALGRRRYWKISSIIG